MPPDPDLEALDRLLPHYGLRRSGAPQHIAAGTLNRNYRVPLAVVDGIERNLPSDNPDATTVFARRYRPDLAADEIQREHAITGWVADRGIPTVAPLTTAEGDTVVEIDGVRWSIFPWVTGRTPSRGAITASEAESIGDAHGRVQQALAAHPESAGATMTSHPARLAWDTATALEILARIETAAEAASAPRDLLEALAFRRRLLEGDQPRPFADFAELPCQLLHGDFHDDQVLLAPSDTDDTVVGIVDWELTRVAARIWELVRALSYSQLLETDGLEAYLRGYRRHVTLSEQECRAGIDLWWQTRLHSAWVYEAYVLQGNDRVAPLLLETDAHLRRFADERWRTAIADRLVAAATG